MNMPMLKLAGCVIRNENMEVLLLHRNKGGVQQWELPGGKLEKGESLEAAALREIKEELGVKVSIVANLGGASFSEREMSFHYTWYEAKIIGQPSIPSIREPQAFDELRYWPIPSLIGRTDLSANVRNLLTSGVLEGGRMI